MVFDKKVLKIASKITAATLSESGKLDEASAVSTVKFLNGLCEEIADLKEREDFSENAFKAAGRITAAACEEAKDCDFEAAAEFFTAVYEDILPITAEDFDEDAYKYASKITAAACEECEEPTKEMAKKAAEFFKTLYFGMVIPKCNGRFVTKETKAGHSFKLLAGNNKIIGVSEVYSSENAMKKGIDSVRNNAPKAGVEDQTEEDFEKVKHPKFEIYEDKAKEFRFRLKATNGEIILVSEGYKTKASCEKGIDSVRKNALAEIE